jgi:hypothetical protein
VPSDKMVRGCLVRQEGGRAREEGQFVIANSTKQLLSRRQSITEVAD